MFRHWAGFVTRRKWLVLAGWVIIVAGFVVLERRTEADFAERYSLPGTESQRARNILQARFPTEAASTATLVVHAPAGLDQPTTRARVEALAGTIRAIPQVASVTTPYGNRALVSPDGRTGLGTIRFDDANTLLDRTNASAVLDATRAASSGPVQFELSGQPIRRLERSGPGQSEAIGLAAATVVLLVAFGSVVAMGLPILTALVGLVCGFAIVTLLSTVTDLMAAAPSFAAMLGIGVGIDYSLFIVTRFREGIAEGRPVSNALERTMATAGRSVLVAGTAVVIALLGLYLVGIPLMATLGLIAATVVAFAVFVALTLLPALLAILGRRVDWLSIRRRARHDPKATGLYRFSLLVQRFPVPFLVASFLLLGALALPLLDIQLGAADDGHAKPSSTTRRAYDLQAQAFGPGFNGPLFVVVEREEPLARDVVLRVQKALRTAEGVVTVSPPRFNSEGTTAVFTVTPAFAPQARETRALVDHLRAETLPEILSRSDPRAVALVSGPTAALVDVTERMETRLVPFFAAVVGLSIVLLLVAFRSVAVPLKAAVLNFAAIGAALGVSVAVFQWGWLGRAAGLERTGPIESYLPMVVFAVLFGLSMDYEVFLISRIRERYLETGDAKEAIAYGVASSGRVISAAGAILVVVFLSFVLTDQRMVKEFGLTQAVAILLDATVVRLVMVPAAMQLLGGAAWWLPGPFAGLLPSWAAEDGARERTLPHAKQAAVAAPVD